MLLESSERPVRRAGNLTAIYEPTVQKMWDPQRLITLLIFTACDMDSFTSLYFSFCIFLIFSYFKVILCRELAWRDC
jgi:hypothetical protein